jgi:hypothetical protein
MNTKFVLWCQQHQPTKDQEKELNGVVCYLKDISPDLFKELQNTGTKNLRFLAEKLIDTFALYDIVVLPIGSPAFIMVLGDIIPNDIKSKIRFAHSERDSVDIPQPDGTVIKKSVFKHIKFFNPWD